MNDLLVIMGATKVTQGMLKYQAQLRESGILMYVLKLDQVEDNVGYNVRVFREMAKEYSDFRKLIFSDAFDVQFFGSKKEVLAKIPDDQVLLAAERNCYPDQTLAPLFKETSPWKFVNGGLSAGSPKAFLAWCDQVESHPFYDPRLVNQSFFNRAAMDGTLPGKLDTHTSLFYCLYGEKDELQFENGLPVNRVFDSRPNFIHANGKWPTEEVMSRRNGKQLFMTKVPVTVTIGVHLCKECRDRLEMDPESHSKTE